VTINSHVDDGFHHGQVFQVVVCLEEGVACEELDQNATNAPNIAGERPAESEDDFRGTVVSGRHYRGVVFILESCGTKIDEANLGV